LDGFEYFTDAVSDAGAPLKKKGHVSAQLQRQFRQKRRRERMRGTKGFVQGHKHGSRIAAAPAKPGGYRDPFGEGYGKPLLPADLGKKGLRCTPDQIFGGCRAEGLVWRGPGR